MTNNPTQNSAKPVAIYVHGLASAAIGSTYGILSRRYTQYEWISTDFGEDLEANITLLNSLIEKYDAKLVVGSSMGGLATLYATAPAAIKIAHNPALSVADCVRHTIGLGTHQYLYERQDGVSEFTLTEEHCCKWEEYIANHKITLGTRSYALFSVHDELLGEQATLEAEKIVADAGFKVYTDEEGQHRLTGSTIRIIDTLLVE